MNETLANVAALCVPIICTLIMAGGVYLASLISEQTDEIQQRTDNETAAHYIGMAGEVIAQAVAYVAQTYADELKKAGTFNKEAQEKAFEMARARAVQILGPAAMKALGEIYGDVDVWISTKIEQACREQKLSGAADAATVTATAASVATSIAANAAQQIKAEASVK